MALPTIAKDTDQTIELTLTDENSNPVDIGTLAGMVVEVFQDRHLMDKFSLNAQAGFQAINVTDSPNGVFRIYLNNSVTSLAHVGKIIYYEIKTTAVDVNFAGGTVEKSTGKIALATLIDSSLQSTTFV